MRAPRLALAASVVLGLEAVALLGIALFEVFALASGEASIVPTAIALIVLTVIGVIALAAFSFGTLRGRTWARSGAVVLQVLAVVVALAALTLEPRPWPVIFAVGIPGVLGFALLIASTRAEALGDQQAEEDERAEPNQG